MAKILIVDDAKFMRVTLANILESHYHQVIGEAENGQEAFDLYKKLKPEIVTMDVTMPGVSGIEALREIKSFDPHAKIIMCSALGQQKVLLDCIEAGAKDFIVKPFEEARVLDAINRLIG